VTWLAEDIQRWFTGLCECHGPKATNNNALGRQHATQTVREEHADLDFINPVQYVKHLLEDLLQLQRQFQTKSTSFQQLEQVRPQLQNIIFPAHRQPIQRTHNQQRSRNQPMLDAYYNAVSMNGLKKTIKIAKKFFFI